MTWLNFLLKEQDPRILFYIGRESTRLGSLGFIIDIGRKLGTPEQAVRFSLAEVETQTLIAGRLGYTDEKQINSILNLNVK